MNHTYWNDIYKIDIDRSHVDVNIAVEVDIDVFVDVDLDVDVEVYLFTQGGEISRVPADPSTLLALARSHRHHHTPPGSW